jgi:large subunit ribosomal protein L17
MRHQKHKYKLGVSPSHRIAMLRNLGSDLIKNGYLKSTETRVRALRIFIEKLVTKAKVDTVANRRYVFSKLNNKAAVEQLFKNVAPKFKERNGGYTRTYKIADTRVGDGTKLSLISFLD